MSYDNLINGFMDGSLDSVQEETLFSAIANSEELRSQFKQQLAIEKTCKQYAASLAPPAQSTVGVFSALGIKIKPVANPSIATTATVTKSAFLGKVFYGITGAIIATLLTSFVFISYIIPEEKADVKLASNNNSVYLSNIDELLYSQEIPTSIPIVTSYEQKENNKRYVKDNTLSSTPKNSEKEKESIIESNNIVTEEKQATDNNTIVQTQNDIKESHTVYSNPLSLELPNNNMSSRFTSIYQSDNSYLPNITAIPRKLGFQAEVKGSQYYSLLNTTVPQPQNVNFSNMGINLFYNLTDNFNIGIALRQENFAQRYEGTDEAGNDFIYKQNPNLISFGVIGRYNFIKIGQFGLFGQAELGANKAGTLGRIATGIEFTPENVIYMNFGIEASGLRYYHNDRIFYSPKAGLFYSIGIKF